MSEKEIFYIIFDRKTQPIDSRITKKRLNKWYKDLGYGVWVFIGVSSKTLIGIK